MTCPHFSQTEGVCTLLRCSCRLGKMDEHYAVEPEGNALKGVAWAVVIVVPIYGLIWWWLT